MVIAMNTVDGIGLASPICHEFDLPRKILEGQVHGPLAYKLDDQQFA